MYIKKQTRASFETKGIISTTRILQLLHMDLFSLTTNLSLGRKQYALVIVDNCSRFTWTLLVDT